MVIRFTLCSASMPFSDLTLPAATLPLLLAFWLIFRDAEFGPGVAVSGVCTGESTEPSKSFLRLGRGFGFVLIFAGGSDSKADRTDTSVSRF